MRRFNLLVMILFSAIFFNSSSAWSIDRFVDLQDGSMLDTVNSLRWLKNANCTDTAGGIVKTGGKLNWAEAMVWSNNLAAGPCGLADGSAIGEWHLPTREELTTLVAAPDNYRAGTLTSAGFTDVQSGGTLFYWSSSNFYNYPAAWIIRMLDGYESNNDKTAINCVWPVRGGQHWSTGALLVVGTADFGNQTIGSVSPGHQFVLKNSGTSSLPVTAMALGGANTDQFTLATGGVSPCSSLSPTLAAGTSCTLLVAARPTSAGSKSATLTVTTADGSAVSPLTTTGTMAVTYNGNGNNSGSAPDDNSGYAPGATATVLGNSGALTRVGYAFDGWNTAADGSGITYLPGASFTVTSNTTLYARWTAAIAQPAGLVGWWRGEGNATDSVSGNNGTLHSVVAVVENNTATATCGSGSSIASFSSIFGSGASIVNCGSCTISATSCSVAYNTTNCGDPLPETLKSGVLNLSCVAADSSGFATGKVGKALVFNGASDYVSQGATYKGIVSSSDSSSFTMEFWAKPTATIGNLPSSQTISGTVGISGQRYAIFPEMHNSSTEAGAGVSVGTNGIAVVEHAGYYMPAPLVYTISNDIAADGWLHIAVVYESRTPRLYVNGVLKQTGLSSGRTVYPSSAFGEVGAGYGFYGGSLDELHIFNRALTSTEIQSIYNAGSAGLAQRPTITSISPSSGPAIGGTTVVITGTNLGGASSVKFGDSATTGISADSDSQLTVVAPASSAGTFDVTVTTPGGTSAVSAADQFTYMPMLDQTISFGPAPVISVAGRGVVTATASSGLAVTFSSLTTPVCTISGATVTGVAVGPCTIAANQPGEGIYNAAAETTQNFTITAASAPTVSTGVATSVTATGATLNATVNANYSSVTVSFEYGTTTAYGNSVTAAQSPLFGGSATAVSAPISGLTPNTIYHFRVKAVNTVTGTVSGNDGTFTSAPPRFLNLNDGTMLDTSNSLRWLRKADCTETAGGIDKSNGYLIWSNAGTWSNGLASGKCGLSDGTAAGDWRLPTIQELTTLVAAPDNYRADNLNEAGFTYVQPYIYWSSDIYHSYMDFPWGVSMEMGYTQYFNEINQFQTLPVRNGKHWILAPLVIVGSADFGTQTVGAVSPGHQFNLKNSGTTPLTITSIALGETDATEFTLATGGGSPCSSLAPTLAGGASCTVIVAAKPATGGSKSASLTVTTAGGGTAVPLTSVAIYAVPTVTVISPTSGSAFGGTSVTITGSGFCGDSSVSFAGKAATGVIVNSFTQLSAVSPANVAGLIADITVTTPGGSSATSSADLFSYTQDQAMNFTTGRSYTKLADAIAAAGSGAEIRAYASQFDGAFLLGRDIFLNGGFNAAFEAKDSVPTSLNGSLTALAGNAGIEAVTVKGVLTIQGGSLRANGVTVAP